MVVSTKSESGYALKPRHSRYPFLRDHVERYNSLFAVNGIELRRLGFVLLFMCRAR